jgi:predicted AlkP superfamily phosphohydrolase/phosphomutase
MFNVAEELVTGDRDLQLVMLYVGDFDSVCHAFWPYRFPDQYPTDRPAPADVNALGPVIDRYLSHVDERIGKLIAAFSTPPNVLVVADHGFEPSRMTTLWKAWHSRYGFFLAGGPDVRRTDTFLDVSYFDIAPTIVDLLGFEPAPDLKGRSIRRR